MAILGYYKGKTILIAGGAGLVGTALCYKLITAAQPEKIYVLVRNGEERLWQSWSSSLPPQQFTLLRESPLIVPLAGDACIPETLGLPESILTTLRETVSIVFNLASKIRLFDSLPETKKTNLDSAINVADVATTFKKLERFVWASSAFANAHLHWVDPEADATRVKETIYPLVGMSPEFLVGLEKEVPDTLDVVTLVDTTNPEAELKELEEKGVTDAYLQSFFPTGYAYIKNLTERLLLARYGYGPSASPVQNQQSLDDLHSTKPKLPHLLFFRPSFIGPALREPVPSFEIFGSTPISTFAGYMIYVSRTGNSDMIWSLPTRNNRGLSVLIDECPIDLVTNQLLVHTAVGTEGPVHAVVGRGESGAKHEDILLSFEPYMHEYLSYIPYSQRPKVNWVDDRTLLERFKTAHLDGETYSEVQEREFGSVAKMWSSLGSCFLFEDEKTRKIWREVMSDEDRKLLPLMVRSKDELLRALKLRKHRNGEVLARELKNSGMLSRGDRKSSVNES